jgi:transposase
MSASKRPRSASLTMKAIIAERKVASTPDAIAEALEPFAVTRAGLETGPLSVWLWNGLKELGVPIVCMDARHENAALKMMPAKTDRYDAIDLAQITRTGGCKSVHVKSTTSYEARALLASRSQLAQIRCDLENLVRSFFARLVSCSANGSVGSRSVPRKSSTASCTNTTLVDRAFPTP